MAQASPFIKFDSFQQATEYAEQTGSTIMFMDNQVIDVTTFVNRHPGGANNILNAKDKQITHEIKAHFPLTQKLAESMTIGFIGQQKYRIIDSSKPLVRQIWSLDQAKYNQVIHYPHWFFVSSPRLFQSEFLQKSSYSKWWHVSIIPSLIIVHMFLGIQLWEQFNPIKSISIFLLGTLFFTLIQYCSHRFIFHAEWYLPDFRILRMLHFFLHGVHHMLPNDPNRLVLPPQFALITIIFAKLTFLNYFYFQDPILGFFFWSGYLIGYVVYDITHYFLHFLDTSKHPGTYFSRLQKYHNQHHYGGEHAGFGVSSKLWDIVFRSSFKFNREKTY